MSERPVRVRLLGEFAFANTRRPVDPWNPGRARTLFGYLLVNRNTVVLKERLHQVLWPAAPYEPGSSGLKVTVHALRQALQARAGDVPGAFEVRYQDRGYVLRTGDAVWVDVEEFEALFHRTRAAEARCEPAAAARLCEQAAELYRGDFLPGDPADWAAEQREWLRGIALRVMRQLIRVAMHRRDSATAMYYCRRALHIDPCDEEAYRALMLVHARKGEIGQVKRWHELCRLRLDEHLSLPPADATNRLLRHAMRTRAPAATAISTP